jgi:hypothetical protein
VGTEGEASEVERSMKGDEKLEKSKGREEVDEGGGT